MTKETARQIDEAAALWVVRLDRGLSPEEERELEAWVAADSRRHGSFARMRALASHTERALGLGPDYRPERFRAPREPLLTRRRLTQWGLAAAGCAAAVGGIFWAVRGSGRYSTQLGQLKVIALADGSIIKLNTASAVSVDFSKNRRLVHLQGGEALFEVAKDAARPFLVRAGDLEVRVVGTIFTVSRLPNAPVQVLVQEGIVEASQSSAPTPNMVRLSANMRGVVTTAGTLATFVVAPAEVEHKLAWLEGRILFDNKSLAAAAAEFARYSDTRIVIDDPDLARAEISGSFEADDPVGFGRATAEALRVRVEVSEGEVRLFR